MIRIDLGAKKAGGALCVLDTAGISPMGMDSFKGGLCTSSNCLNIISKKIGRLQMSQGGIFPEKCVQIWTLTKLCQEQHA